MKNVITGLILSCTAAAPSLHAAPEQLERAQNAISAYQKELGAALKKALSEEGPIAAIKVCADKAPEIAEQIGKNHDLTVARVSDKPRNPAAQPDELDQKALQKLKILLAEDEKPEVIKVVNEQGNEKYYQAITVAPLCTTCHGTNVADDVKQTLLQYYPSDKATGYKVGDLRGAFVVSF